MSVKEQIISAFSNLGVSVLILLYFFFYTIFVSELPLFDANHVVMSQTPMVRATYSVASDLGPHDLTTYLSGYSNHRWVMSALSIS